jgi:hypothetical protein
LDWYWGAPPSETLGGTRLPADRQWRDPAALDTDRTSAFCTHWGASLSAEAAALCVAGALAARLDAAESPALADAYAAFVAARVSATSETLDAALRLAQDNPQIGVFGRLATELTPAAAAGFGFIESSLGVTEPVVLPTALFTLSRSLTADAHPEWNNEPDIFDVVRSSLDGEGRKWAMLWRDYASERALWGLAAAAGLGSAGLGSAEVNGAMRPELPPLAADWELRYSSLPRRVAGGRALEPLGSALVAVELDDIPLGARLTVVLDWEPPGAFVWSVLAVDRDGRRVNRWDLPYLERELHLEQTLMNFEGAKRLLIVGTNLGGIDLSHPFDPDHEPWEPHAYSVYLVPGFE